MRFQPSPRRGTAFALALAAALLAACADDAPSPVAAPANDPRPDAARDTAPFNDMEVERRFDLDVDVEGALRPGQPIHLTLRGTARFTTKEADVRVTLPEVAAAEEGGWEEVVIELGKEIRPHLRLRRGFAAGESFRQRATLTIPEPGYYAVYVTAHQRSDDRETDRPHLVGDVSGRVLWLWIDEKGGRVTERFEAGLFPAGIRKQRGPRSPEDRPARLRRKDAVIACSVYTDSTAVLNSCTGTGDLPTVIVPSATASFTATYNDMDGSASAPLAGARYTWKVTATGTSSIVASGEGLTSPTGTIPTIDCKGPTNERTIEMKVHTLNERVRVYWGNLKELTGSYTGPCGGSEDIRGDHLTSKLFTNLVLTAEGHQRVFGASPDRINAGVYGDGKTFYDYSAPGGEVHVTYATEMINGEQGVMVAAHEHGHLWQDRTLYQYPARNGLIRYFSRDCQRVHPPEHTSSLQCAWAEGFADWYGVLVRQASLPTWQNHLETNYFYKTCVTGSRRLDIPIVCSDDGSVVQGAIHAFLWDLSDPASGEAHDAIQVSPTTITNAIRTCEVLVSNEYRPYDGIDHLIYCMGYRSPYVVNVDGRDMSFFSARGTRPTGARGGSVSGGDAFRRLWVVNLNSRRVGESPDLRDPAFSVSQEPLPSEEPSCGLQVTC